MGNETALGLTQSAQTTSRAHPSHTTTTEEPPTILLLASGPAPVRGVSIRITKLITFPKFEPSTTKVDNLRVCLSDAYSYCRSGLPMLGKEEGNKKGEREGQGGQSKGTVLYSQYLS